MKLKGIKLENTKRKQKAVGEKRNENDNKNARLKQDIAKHSIHSRIKLKSKPVKKLLCLVN